MNNSSAPSMNLWLWPALVISAAALMAITSGSFWIDEFSTHMFAIMPTLRGCWEYMERIRYPEIQAPFYMAYIWAWTHAFGSSEWTMRLAGAPWFIAGGLIFATYVGRLMRASSLVALLVAFSPFAWYYLNEARVYAFQLGFALATVASAIATGRATINGTPDPVARRIFVIALVGLCGSNILGAVFGFTIVAAFLTAVPPRRWWSLVRATPVTNSVGALSLMGLAAYYQWTVQVHPQASSVGTTTPQTVIFVFYELLGFVGLGPGRNTLRSDGAAALKPFLPVLLVFGMTGAFVLFLGMREAVARVGRRRVALFVTISLAPLLALIGIGMATHFRLLGRHVTPMLPLVLLLASFGVERAWRMGIGQRVAATIFCLLWLGSSFSIRWTERQRKDEYRGAAAIARAALQNGEIVWWNADLAGAGYYGLPIDDRAVRGFYPLMNVGTQLVHSLPVPSVIIASKPDTYDPSHGVASYVQQHQYAPVERLPAFVVYRRSVGR